MQPLSFLVIVVSDRHAVAETTTYDYISSPEQIVNTFLIGMRHAQPHPLILSIAVARSPARLLVVCVDSLLSLQHRATHLARLGDRLSSDGILCTLNCPAVITYHPFNRLAGLRSFSNDGSRDHRQFSKY